MELIVRPSAPRGRVRIPGSKSHTIRALYFATFAEGTSVIQKPMLSADAKSAMTVCKALGAEIEEKNDQWIVKGCGPRPRSPDLPVDVGNSGTSLRIGAAMSALGTGPVSFTGDGQIRSRPMGPLLQAMRDLGTSAVSDRGNDCAPISIRGPLSAGATELEAVTSQYVTALLMACPLIPEGTTGIRLTRLNEKPYVSITLWWLKKLRIELEHSDDLMEFSVPGGQTYPAFNEVIPGDFSSATFFMVLAAISRQEIILENLDMTDPQGDKAVLGYLEKMGAEVDRSQGAIRIRGGKLTGCNLDLNATPDALPAMAVAACFAEGKTVLGNVPQARLKETDRIRVMWEELRKMGADIEELPDGLMIRKSDLHAADLHGHADHRVVMALSLAGMRVQGTTTIDTAESIDVTFPEYVGLMQSLGGDMAYAS